MRIARAGETPTDDAALVNAVVLNGAGGLRVLRFDSTDLTTPGRLGVRERGLRLGLLPELVHLVVCGEDAVGMLERGEHLPVGLRHVRAPLQLALDDDRQRRALHAADGQELRAEAAGRERHEARQRRAPDQVDVLARLTGAGQRLRQLDEVGERLLDLLLREGGVARALDAGREARRSRSASGSRRGSPRAPRGRSARPRGRSRSRSRPSSASLACLRSALWTFFWTGSLTSWASISSRGSTLRHSEYPSGKAGFMRWPLRPITRWPPVSSSHP